MLHTGEMHLQSNVLSRQAVMTGYNVSGGKGSSGAFTNFPLSVKNISIDPGYMFKETELRKAKRYVGLHIPKFLGRLSKSHGRDRNGICVKEISQHASFQINRQVAFFKSAISTSRTVTACRPQRDFASCDS